ncbi:MAG: efflux RND transporter periplasmic adaptor subunit [Leptolyngbyaceae bacterium]|nr:efflux RND transporter periplasmic adaptor subunit [Leptolyngbyaceae bacterium]
MTDTAHHSWLSQTFSPLLGVGLALALPITVLAHAGHGDEFHSGDSQPILSTDAISVDAQTAKRLGIQVAPIQRQRMQLGITATGQIATLPGQRVEVTTPVKGTIAQLLVEPGDRVKAGQTLAILSSPELAELRVAALEKQAEALADVQQAQADLRLAQQNYERQRQLAEVDLQQAQSELSFAQERYDRDRELAATGALPRRQVLESETQLVAAKAAKQRAASRLSLLEAEAQLKRAKSAVQVAQSRSALSDRTYQTRLRQLGTRANTDGTLTITAPIAGVVADREITLGESGEDAGKKILTLVNGNQVQVTADIYEKDISQIQVGQPVRVKVSGLGRTFTGKVSVIGSVVEGATRVIPVQAILANPEDGLKPGMFAEVEILTELSPVVVPVIPQAAVVEAQGQSWVFVENGSAFQPVTVTLGRTSGDAVEVKSGLFEGDRVVVQGANQLYAQTLRGGSKPQTPTTPQPTTASLGCPQPPWWLIGLGTGAIALGTFAAGAVWAGTRNRQGKPAHSNPPDSNFPSGLYASLPSSPHPSVRVVPSEEAQLPRVD